MYSSKFKEVILVIDTSTIIFTKIIDHIYYCICPFFLISILVKHTKESLCQFFSRYSFNPLRNLIILLENFIDEMVAFVIINELVVVNEISLKQSFRSGNNRLSCTCGCGPRPFGIECGLRHTRTAIVRICKTLHVTL